MRIVPGAILTAVAFLAISVPALAFDSGGKATTSLPNTSNVHAGKGGEADFIYIPPPPPSGDHPLFHSQSFEYLPSSDTGKAGELVRPVSGAIPVSALTSLQERAQMPRHGNGWTDDQADAYTHGDTASYADSRPDAAYYQR